MRSDTESNERLHACLGDRNGLLPIDLFQILLAISGERDQFRRIGGKIALG